MCGVLAWRLHRWGSGLTWEASRYITTGTQAVWWSNAKAVVNPGMDGKEKAWEEVKLGLGLERKIRTLTGHLLQIPLGSGAGLCGELA